MPKKKNNDGPSNPMKCKIIAEMLFEDNNYACINNEYYQYSISRKNTGIWQRKTFEFIEAKAAAKFEFQQGFGPPTSHNIKETLRVLRNVTEETFEKQILTINNKPFKMNINLKDGILNLDTMKIKEYTREDFAFNKLPFNYEKDSQCPRFLNFVKKCFADDRFDDEDDVLLFLLEWMGYSFLPGNKYEKCLVIHGEGGGGKGTLEGVWRKIVGPSNVSELDVSEINNPAHIESSKNKLVNFSGDLNYGQQIDTGVMKRAISGEMVRHSTKYKKTGSFPYTAKNIIMCNDLPHVKNVGTSSSRRLHILEFNGIKYSEKTIDYEIKGSFDDELGAIFSHAMDGLLRLRKNNKFTIPKRIPEDLAKYMKDNDPIQQWLEEDELLAIDPKTKLSYIDETIMTLKTSIYKGYKDYMLRSGYKGKLNNKNFYKELKKKGYEEKRTKDGRYFVGIKNPLTSQYV